MVVVQSSLSGGVKNEKSRKIEISQKGWGDIGSRSRGAGGSRSFVADVKHSPMLVSPLLNNFKLFLYSTKEFQLSNGSLAVSIWHHATG